MGNDNPTRVLFFAESLTLCHVTRPLVLARSLANGDYELHVACPPEYQRLYEGLTVQLHPLNSVPSAQSLARVNAGKPVFAPETLRNYVREDLKLIKQIDPDCIVGDMRLSLSLSARLTETPYAAIVNAYWSPWAQPYYDAPELPITRLLGTGLTVPLIRAAMPLAFAMHCRPLNQVRREHGLPSLGSDLRQVYSDADYVLYADAAELVPTGQLPANHVYLGPILWSHPNPLPEWWKSIPQDRPVVYVSLGSSGRSELLQQVLEGLEDLPITVIAGTSGRTTPARIPSNALLADYLPAEAACRRAQLLVSHGGSASSYVALAQGIPVLGIPSNLDQFVTLHYIERAGAGLHVRAEQAKPRAIGKAARDLLENESYRAAAQRLADAFSKYDAGGIFKQALGNITRTAPVR